MLTFLPSLAINGICGKPDLQSCTKLFVVLIFLQGDQPVQGFISGPIILMVHLNSTASA